VTAQQKKSEQVQDTVEFPLKIRAGGDIVGPAIWFAGRNILNAEGYISADINEKIALFAGAGYSDYKYSQYNYEFLSNGLYFKTGVDLNILKPEVSAGKYWAGIGIRYGISRFTSETPFLITRIIGEGSIHRWNQPGAGVTISNYPRGSGLICSAISTSGGR